MGLNSKKIKKLPNSPGVYMFLDGKKRIIYVGKAISLKKRVSSYFQTARPRDTRGELLVNEIKDIEIIKTASEAEALIYEAALIKDNRPRFNIELKDDKSYPFLKLTVGDEYPRLYLTRKRINDGAVYYGPYVNVKLLKEALSFMKKVFPLRSCRNLKKKVCLEYHIGQCLGPCEGKILKKEYDEIVKYLKIFLEGRKGDLIKSLEKKMAECSKQKEYEKAIAIKSRIQALTAMQELHAQHQQPIFGELDELRNALDIKKTPHVVECFDISNISGTQAVGSMVLFKNGKPDKAGYRKFKIKKVKNIDDYSMIREVVKRRYLKLTEEGLSLPDLVLIDGGKGHLRVAKDELNSLGLGSLPIAAIAKEYNHLYVSGRKEAIRLSPGSRLLLLIQRIRDEAHRFAIRYHRSLRSKNVFYTELRNVRGVGPVTENMLLDKFKSVQRIKGLSFKDLLKAGVDQKTAESITDYFKTKL